MAISVRNNSLLLNSKGVENGNSPVEDFYLPLRNLFSPVNSSELLFFTSQLSLMLEIETPLNLALTALREQTENSKFKKIIDIMLRDIEEGGQLSQAMKRHPKVFDSVYISMVAAGESGGFLKDILDRIVEIMEKRQALITQLRSALTYPLVLCVVSVIVIIFIMVGVLPKFNSFFMSKIELLPLTTRTLMVLSDVLKTYWWLMIISATGIVTGFILFIKSKRGKGIVDWLLINIPFIADLANRIYIAQFLRILGNLMQSKVPLLEALDVTQGTVTNKYFKQLVSDIKTHVQAGGKFSQPFSGYSYVPESVKQMVFTGEESGRLPKVMLRLAEYYDMEVEKNLKILASLIEPLALIIMGVVIGLIVSSVILPLFRLAHVMQ